MEGDEAFNSVVKDAVPENEIHSENNTRGEVDDDVTPHVYASLGLSLTGHQKNKHGATLNLSWSAGCPNDQVAWHEVVFEELQCGLGDKRTEEPVSKQAENTSLPGG